MDGQRDGFGAPGGSRVLYSVKLINNFDSNNAFGTANIPIPKYGCTWTAYYDVGFAADLSIESVNQYDYAIVANASAAVLRVRRLDRYGYVGMGGFKMSGDGVWTIMQNAQAAGQNVVNGPNSFAGEFWFDGTWQYVTLEGSTFKARPMPFVDSAATSLPMGALVEYGTSTEDGVLAVQRAGQRAGAPLAGTVCQDWTGSNPNTQQIAPIVCVGGSRVPMLTSTTATPGQLLKPSTTSFGTAVASSGITDGPAAGISYITGTSPTMTYVKPLWAAKE